MTSPFMILIGLLVGIALLFQLSTSWLVARRYRTQPQTSPITSRPGLAILRPVCGLEPGLRETLSSSYHGLTHEDEVLFCLADEKDPAIPVVRAVMDAYPAIPSQLLVGNSAISANPKLNNLEKGWLQAHHDWIAMIDSNVMLPQDYPQILFDSWDEQTGLVSSPPLGVEANGLWARVEGAILNSYQGRCQLASDELGAGFAQGKLLFWHREILEAAGGMKALANNLAEDIASTKIVRSAGKKVSLVHFPFAQPLGQREFGEVWKRQVRWARVRREGFPLLFAMEPLSGPLLPSLSLALLPMPIVSPLLILVFLIVWYGGEAWMVRKADWPLMPGDISVWVLRDMLLPAIWLLSFTSRGFDWRGNVVDPKMSTVTARK
nr:glycosyltransferase [uncultured Cohaesibacter sp.]